VAVSVTCYSDPGCPWAYSANPALAVLRWRYGSGLRWRLVTVGLTETPEEYLERGYTPALMALGNRAFRERFGMPFATEPRERVCATGPACRAIVAARLLAPGREWDVLRALQLAWFTTARLLDRAGDIAAVLAAVDGLDVPAIVGAIDSPEVVEAYQADRAEARTAEGSPTEAQGKAVTHGGPVRYTAPSLIFSREETRLEAGGWQSLEAYDVLIANLDPALRRAEPAASPAEVLEGFPDGLATQEIAAVMAPHNLDPDRDAAEDALVQLVAEGRATRIAAGDDAVWRPAAASVPA